MADYIDRNTLLNALRLLEDKMSDSAHTVMNQVISIVADSEAADVVERKYGQWADQHFIGGLLCGSVKCSMCGMRLIFPISYYFADYNFCPECGAAMSWQDMAWLDPEDRALYEHFKELSVRKDGEAGG